MMFSSNTSASASTEILLALDTFNESLARAGAAVIAFAEEFAELEPPPEPTVPHWIGHPPPRVTLWPRPRPRTSTRCRPRPREPRTSKPP